ncbi:glycosyltransferase [Streptosporangium sp. NPDC051022]|uniref:glycosyltransferase n=1 Tax=Streptosporangium sp. NPDC051022 TaxID=3155752 RepID=UPI003436DE24
MSLRQERHADSRRNRKPPAGSRQESLAGSRQESPAGSRQDRRAERGQDTGPSVLGCHIGFETSPEALAGLCEGTGAAGTTWIDLDVAATDHPITTGEPEGLVLLARTPADLRRAVPYGGMLPKSHTLTVIVAESPPWRLAPVPAPDGAAFWRALHDVRVRRGQQRARGPGRAPGYAWRIDMTFGKPVPAGGVLRAVARGLGGLSRETLHAPVVSLAGVGSGQWRPGDPNVTLAPVSGPVPDRRDAPGCDVLLRSLHTTAPEVDPPDPRAGPPVIDRPEPVTGGLRPVRPAEAVAAARSVHPTPGLLTPGDLAPAHPTSGRLTPGDLASVPPAFGRLTPDDLIPVPPIPVPPASGRLTPGDLIPVHPALDRLTPDHLAPVDERSVCPIGFLPETDGPLGELVERREAYEVVGGDEVVVRVPFSGTLTDMDVARLRGLAGVAVDLHADWTAPLGVARVVCGLAAAGVPVVAEPGTAWRGPLGAELAGLLDGFGAEQLSDALAREQYSIRLRRCALDLHGVAGRWRRIGAACGLRSQALPTVSVLLCTRRPDMVAFALEQVARQRGPEVEVILTLHGFSAGHPDTAPAVAAYKGAITVIEADPRLSFGDALNQAAERATGAYLTKMDDDDWYGPGHLSDLLLAQRYSSADLVGSAPEFVHLERIGVTVRRALATETYTGVVAGGTMLMSRAAFDNVGGFRPLPRTVDGQLLESVSVAGGRIYRTHGLNYILRRREASGHTWQEPINAFLRSFRRQWRGLHANPLMEMEGLSALGEHDEA